MLPSGSDLQYFLAVCQNGSFSKAANHLGIAQPSLTLAIQRLESTLGTQLFLRSRHGAKPTRAGERLRIDARELLQKWEGLRGEVKSIGTGVRGRFTLGCHPAVAIYSLPLFLPDLLKENPEIEISLEHGLSRHIAQKVVQMEVDLGLVINAQVHPDLVMKSLIKDEVRLWKSTEDRNPDVLIYEPSLLQSQDILKKLKRSGWAYRRSLECSDLQVVKSLVESGAGHAILPARVAQPEPSGLKPISKSPVFYDELFLIYRTEQRNVKAVQALSTAIQQAFRP
ncbi:MAG: LysR family transcriptional regulator [Bdellovibrionales bacterium]